MTTTTLRRRCKDATLASYLGEGIHTGLRRGSDTEASTDTWQAIHDSTTAWSDLVRSTTQTLTATYGVTAYATHTGDENRWIAAERTGDPVDLATRPETVTLTSAEATDLIYDAFHEALSAISDSDDADTATLYDALTAPESGLGDAIAYVASCFPISGWVLTRT